MSSEEEKKAIEFFEKRKNICLENANICDENDYDGEAEYLREEKMYIDTVLNIITKQQNRIEKLKHSIEIILSELPEDMDYKAIEKLLED